jgi:outer membrane protein
VGLRSRRAKKLPSQTILLNSITNRTRVRRNESSIESLLPASKKQIAQLPFLFIFTGMKLCLIAVSVLLSFFATAQERWDLQRCVLHAMQNNISVKQADIQARLAALEVKLRQAGQYPNLAFNGNGGYNFGRSVNPATNQFENRSIFFNNFSLQSNVNLFNWFSQRYSREASSLSLKAAEAGTEKARNDIALNVATAYLQALLAYEQIEISRVQIGQTTARLNTIRKQVSAGTLPQLNQLELEAQLARDTAAYVRTTSTYQSQLIFLKALLALDMTTPFDIEKPDVRAIPVEPLAALQPADVYAEALKNLPQQRVNQLRYQASLKEIQAAKAAMYPTLSAFGSVQSRYSSLFPDQTNFVATPTGKFDTLGIVEIAPGTIRYAVRPDFSVTSKNISYGRQVFDINLSQAIGLNLSVPIFNNRQLRTARDRAVLNAENIRLQSEADNQKLQQDIYSAYNDAVNALEQYRAAQKAVEASERALELSQRRFDVGLLPLLDLTNNQNNLNRSRIEAVSAQYEYVFRMKLLEFYRGKGMRLQ